MDNYREVEILASQVVADSGTKSIDLDVTEPITELAVSVDVTNDSAISNNVPAERIISKIEIVDGGKVYWSTTGAEAIAVSCYEKGKWPPGWLYEGLSGGQAAWIPMQFGRYLGDETYAVSPTKLLNPQVKVTWAKNALHLTGSVTLGLHAKVMQGVAAPSRALLTSNVRTFTTASSGVEPTQLPIEYPYRRLFVRAELAGTAFSSVLSQYKLDCDTGKIIVFDSSQWTMINKCEEEFGFFNYRKHDFVDNARYVRSWFGSTYAATLAASAGAHILNAYTTSSDNYYASVYSDAGAAETDISAVAWVMGSLPEYVLAYQFGRRDDPATWLASSKFGNIKLSLTQAVASCEAAILLQQDVSLG